MARLIVVALAVGAVVAGGLAIHARNLLEPVDERPQYALFDIERGTSMGPVASRLETAGIVQSALAMRLLSRWRGLDARLHVGEYELSPHQSTEEILEIVTSGRV